MIEVRGLHKELGEFSLRGVDVRIEAGEYFVVLGPTGAGKTVLLECIAGLHKVDRGEVWLAGRDVTGLAPELRNVGYVPQDYVLFPHLSFEQNLHFSLALRKVPQAEATARIAELTEMLGISHLLNRRPRTLSGGEQQRGALARALAPRPNVLLLDEPLSALDEGTRAELIPQLRRISRELGTTIIHVCHNFEEALDLADRIAIMHQGRVRQIGTPAGVFRRPVSPFVARFVSAENLFPVLALDRAGSAIEVGDQVRLQVASFPVETDLLAMIRPEEISVRPRGDAGAGPNEIEGQVTTVGDRGRTIRVQLTGPLPLQIALTRQAFRQCGVSAGDWVLAHCPPEAIHLISQSPDSQ